jgi:REP-associated tyrosine transposase
MPGTYSNILLHVVFSTKRREQWIIPELRERLYPFIGGIVKDEQGVLLSIGGMPDHVHMLVGWRTSDSIANLMRNVKARSSKWVHATFPDTRQFQWQKGYGVFSVSQSKVDAVVRYIGNQEEHHQKKTFKQELLDLLQKHGVKYDEQYMWD